MNKQAKILLIVSGLFTMAIGLSNVFVNVLLWREGKDFILIALYQLMHYIFTPIAFILGGYLSKRKNGIWSLRIGIFLFILFFVCILFLGNSLTAFVIPIGILFGIASGFYWLAFQVLSFDFTGTNNRDTFNGFNGLMASLAGSTAPLLAAFIIDRNVGVRGYFIVFLLSLLLFIGMLLISLTMRTNEDDDTLAMKKIFGHNNESWKNLRLAIGTWGLRNVVIIFIINILIYEVTGSEMSLGQLTFIAGLVLCFAYWLEQKIVKPKHRVKSMVIGAWLLVVAVLGVVFKINYMTLAFFMIVSSFSMPFYFVPMASATFNVLNYTHEEAYRVEYIINKEIVLNIGRTISTVILIVLLMLFDSQKILNYFLLCIGFAQIISLYFLKKLDFWER